MSTKNIVLIGMPGCGKSHIARVLASKTGRDFLDTDSYIKKETGIFPAEHIKKSGEAAFREMEHQALSKLLKHENAVIATGGGIVTNSENKKLLEKETVIWIQRDLDLLSLDHRPLSKDVYKLYEEREALYEDFSDIIVENNAEPESCVSEIKRVCKI